MTTVTMGNRVRRSMSSTESRRREVTKKTWYAAKDCSRSVQRRLEMLSRHRLRGAYGERNKQFMRRSRMQMPSKLRLCWMMKFVSEVWTEAASDKSLAWLGTKCSRWHNGWVAQTSLACIGQHFSKLWTHIEWQIFYGSRCRLKSCEKHCVTLKMIHFY